MAGRRRPPKIPLRSDPEGGHPPGRHHDPTPDKPVGTSPPVNSAPWIAGINRPCFPNSPRRWGIPVHGHKRPRALVWGALSLEAGWGKNGARQLGVPPASRAQIGRTGPPTPRSKSWCMAPACAGSYFNPFLQPGPAQKHRRHSTDSAKPRRSQITSAALVFENLTGMKMVRSTKSDSFRCQCLSPIESGNPPGTGVLQERAPQPNENQKSTARTPSP